MRAFLFEEAGRERRTKKIGKKKNMQGKFAEGKMMSLITYVLQVWAIFSFVEQFNFIGF